MHTSDPCSLTVWMEVCVGLAPPSCSAPQMPPKHRSLGQQWETFQHRSHSPCYTCVLLSLPDKHLLILCSPGPALSAYILLWHLTFVPQILVQSILTPAEKQVALCQPAPWELRPHTNFFLSLGLTEKIGWKNKTTHPHLTALKEAVLWWLPFPLMIVIRYFYKHEKGFIFWMSRLRAQTVTVSD